MGRLCEAVEGLRDDVTEMRQWCSGVDDRLRAVEVAQGGSSAVRSLVRWASNVLSPLAAAGLTILGMHLLGMHGS
ncbi:MAG TPA: hypothetical protein VHW66_18930 [Stellaceae bacterium]|jgi:hypothetical protein|nr:hypothetical protein [Stellaceae bacterium]